MLIFINNIYAQDYSLKVSKTKFSIEEKAYDGYSTDFNLNFDIIKKEWWRYVKKIAVIENHKAYYVITFPPENEDSNTSIKLISVLEENGNSCTLKTGLFNQELNKKYISYSKNVLIDFKVNLFTKSIQKRIVSSEKEAVKISRTIDVNSKKIAGYEYKKQRGKGNIELISNSIRQLETIQDSLKLQLIKVQNKVKNNRTSLKQIR